MKKVYFLVAIVATAVSLPGFAQDSTNRTQNPELLAVYYDIKDALVAGDANTAALRSAAFIKTLGAAEYKAIPEIDNKSLVKDAGKIAETKDLKKQGELFTTLSTNMIAIAKKVKLSNNLIYQAYCPMKKASWLSNEKAIKNPYYGSSMLNCGEVTGTIQ